MEFQGGGDVIFWMTPQERADMKFSQYDNPSLKDKTKDESLGNIKTSDVDVSVVKWNMVCELQVISCENSIYVTNITIKERVK